MRKEDKQMQADGRTLLELCCFLPPEQSFAMESVPCPQII